MAENENPYESPGTDMSSVKVTASGGVLTATMVRHLKEASPWIRFLGILSFIVCGLLALFAIAMIVVPGLSGLTDEMPSWGTGLGVGMGLFYLVVAVVMFFPARYLHRLGSKLRDYGKSGSEADLETAFRNNKSFWKFCGIMAIVYLSLIPVFIVVAAVAGAAARAF